MSSRTRTVVASVGFVGGFLSGLLGVGGGIVFVPGLVIAASLPQRRAHATSLAAILPVGVVGAIVYALNRGSVNYTLALALAVGSVIGAPLGVRALARAPERLVRVLFIAALVVAGVRLLAA